MQGCLNGTIIRQLSRESGVCWFQKDHDANRQKVKTWSVGQMSMCRGYQRHGPTHEEKWSIHYTAGCIQDDGAVGTFQTNLMWLKHTIYCTRCQFEPSTVRPTDSSLEMMWNRDDDDGDDYVTLYLHIYENALSCSLI